MSNTITEELVNGASSNRSIKKTLGTRYECRIHGTSGPGSANIAIHELQDPKDLATGKAKRNKQTIRIAVVNGNGVRVMTQFGSKPARCFLEGDSIARTVNRILLALRDGVSFKEALGPAENPRSRRSRKKGSRLHAFHRASPVEVFDTEAEASSAE